MLNEYINVPVGMLFPSNRRRFISSDAKSDWSTSYQYTTLTHSVLTIVPSPIMGTDGYRVRHVTSKYGPPFNFICWLALTREAAVAR